MSQLRCVVDLFDQYSDTATMVNTEAVAVVPSTPPASSPPLNATDKSLASPPPMSTSMTPPPSSQPVRFASPSRRLEDDVSYALLASPPSTIKFTAGTSLPTTSTIAGADMEQLQDMAKDLVSAVKEARTAAAHFKLQHSLLDMGAQEAAQRAEIEHQMTRKEVEVLQAAEQRHRAALSVAARNSDPPQFAQIDALTQTCRDLEEERDEAERRLARAKRLIELEKDKSELLMEENLLLKKRIRENREHFTRFKSQSPVYATPRDPFATPHRRAPPRFPESTSSHQPFAALLAADQVLSGESLSVPSTPTRTTHASKVKHGHTRGAHSLSSLHTTPSHNRPVTADGFPATRYPMSAPGSQLVAESAERERHDRDSTISISDAEDNGSEDDVQQSQASSLATDMLRKNPGSQESLRLSQGAQSSSNLLQSKLFGNVKKPSSNLPIKRRGSFDDGAVKSKKARRDRGIGLGIDSWQKA